MNIMLNESFPNQFTPNKPQELILHGIGEAMALGKKFIIINAPTGSGKSFISKTLANYSKQCSEEFAKTLGSTCRWQNISFGEEERFGAAILTCTKSLQDQYAELFSDGDVLKGKINYDCGKDEGVCCDVANCVCDDSLKDKCWAARCCPYFNARYDTAVNKCSFYNYSMFLSLPDCVKHKQFLICDEASELEEVLVNEYTVDLDLLTLQKNLNNMMPIAPDEGSSKHVYFRWLEALNGSIMLVLKELTMESLSRNRKHFTKSEMQQYRYLSSVQLAVNQLISCWDDSDWFKLHRDDAHLVFVPYEIDKLAQNFFKYGETVILMSATIVNPKKYAKMLGIDDYYFIDAPSTMDPGRAFISPVSTDFRPNYKNKETMIPKMAKVAKQLCDQFPDKKGIIHTNSFDILNMLKGVLGEGGRFLYRGGNASNEIMMEVHKASEMPTVLVSPSMTHGIDLKGKLGEFQIIMKAPYPNLGDPRINRKFKEDKEWYVDKMLSTLVQACGRCNRTASDLAITFIMDFNAYQALVVNRDKLPAYFNARLSEEAKNSYKKHVKNEH